MTVSSAKSSSSSILKPNLILRKTTTDGSTYTLTNDGQAVSSINQAIFVNDSTYLFTVSVVARRIDTDGENAGWEIKGVASRDVNAASTAVFGVTKNVIYKTTSSWDCNVVADTTNGTISVTCNGDASKTIKWVATVSITEVTG